MWMDGSIGQDNCQAVFYDLINSLAIATGRPKKDGAQRFLYTQMRIGVQIHRPVDKPGPFICLDNGDDDGDDDPECNDDDCTAL